MGDRCLLGDGGDVNFGIWRHYFSIRCWPPFLGGRAANGLSLHAHTAAFYVYPVFYVLWLDTQAAARASSGANCVFNILKRGNSILLAEGLGVFKVSVPKDMAGRTLEECRFRQTTGCNVVAIEREGEINAKPSRQSILTHDTQLVIVGDAEAERRLFEKLHLQSRSS
jgi:hypothetical protein